MINYELRIKMQKDKIKNNKGFALLYAVMLSSILLAITVGVLNIALKEINFSTSAKDTNDAFFAADTGAECALYYDRSEKNIFVDSPSSSQISCNNNIYTVNNDYPSHWVFVITGLGISGQGCVNVAVDKTDLSGGTTVISKGYNKEYDFHSPEETCDSGQNNVERELVVTY